MHFGTTSSTQWNLVIFMAVTDARLDVLSSDALEKAPTNIAYLTEPRPGPNGPPDGSRNARSGSLDHPGRRPDRGYTFDYKRLFLAFGAEGAIAAASLYGAWLFANKYGHEN